MKLNQQQERRKEYLLDTLRYAMAEKEQLIPQTALTQKLAPVIPIDRARMIDKEATR